MLTIEELKRIRVMLEITGDEVGRRMGTSRQTICAIENGRKVSKLATNFYKTIMINMIKEVSQEKIKTFEDILKKI